MKKKIVSRPSAAHPSIVRGPTVNSRMKWYEC